MHCDHAMAIPAESLVRDVKGRVLCRRCAAECKCCGQVFFVEDLDADGNCEECAAAVEEDTEFGLQRVLAAFLAA